MKKNNKYKPLSVKERYFWIFIVSFLLLVNIATSYGISNCANMADIFSSFQLFQEAFTKLRDNYVEEDRVEPKDLVYGAIEGMLESVGDEHTAFLDAQAYQELLESTSGEFGGLGIYISIRDDWLTVIAPIEGTPAYRAGLKPGDIITHINDESTEGISIDEALRKLKGDPGTQVSIKIQREGSPELLNFTITRAIIEIETVKYRFLDEVPGNIGYVRLTAFSEDTTQNLVLALAELQSQGMEKLIFDLRSNPGGRLDTAIAICDLFLNSGKIVYTRARYERDSNVFNASAGNDAVPQDVPMIVLVDGGSASASEIFTGAMQDTNRGYVIGHTTFGKGSVQSVIELDNSDERIAMRVTIAKYYTPTGRDIHGIGLEPDLVIDTPDLTIEEILNEYVLTNSKDYLVTEFLEQHPYPDYTQADVDEFHQTLSNECINVEISRLPQIIRSEALKDREPVVADTEFDEYIQRAIEVFNNNEYPDNPITSF